MQEKHRLKGTEGQAGHPALCVIPEVEKEDELLEVIWTLREEGRLDRDQIVENSEIEGVEETLRKLAKNGWIESKDRQLRSFPRAKRGHAS